MKVETHVDHVPQHVNHWRETVTSEWDKQARLECLNRLRVEHHTVAGAFADVPVPLVEINGSWIPLDQYKREGITGKVMGLRMPGHEPEPEPQARTDQTLGRIEAKLDNVLSAIKSVVPNAQPSPTPPRQPSTTATPIVTYTKDSVEGLRRLLSAEQRYGDAKMVQAKYGLRKSYLYNLMKQGHIASKSVCQPGRKRGKRLFDLKSIEEFLDRQT